MCTNYCNWDNTIQIQYSIVIKKNLQIENKIALLKMLPTTTRDSQKANIKIKTKAYSEFAEIN